MPMSKLLDPTIAVRELTRVKLAAQRGATIDSAACIALNSAIHLLRKLRNEPCSEAEERVAVWIIQEEAVDEYEGGIEGLRQDLAAILLSSKAH